MATGGEEEGGVGMGLAVNLMPPRVCTRQSKCRPEVLASFALHFRWVSPNFVPAYQRMDRSSS